MRLKFQGRAVVFNDKVQFPADTINRVVVCMHDTYTYQTLDVKGGIFNVDFELKPDGLHPNPSRLVDTLKFHFYTSDLPNLVTAGWVCLPSMLKAHAQEQEFTKVIQCNFTCNKVSLLLTHSDASKETLESWKDSRTRPSCLRHSDSAAQIFQSIATNVQNSLHAKLCIDPNNGGSMFSNIATAHSMEGQMTLHTQFQDDMTPASYDSSLMHNTGLTMLAVADALQFHGYTCEVAAQKLAPFLASVCQFAQRSAHVLPYQADMGLATELDDKGRSKLELTEHFKRPFFEPFLFTEGVAGPLFCDDCEGFATWIREVHVSFKFLWEDHSDQWLSLNSGNQFAQMASVAKFLEPFFPTSLFSMDHGDKCKIFSLAMLLGKAVHENVIECNMAMITASAQALGDHAKEELGGHCCIVFVDNAIPDKPVSILAEGTNCMDVDRGHNSLAIDTPTGTVHIPFSEVANQVTRSLLDSDRADERACIHLADLQPGTAIPFYRTMFCQNNTLMATHSENRATFGLDICRLQDEDNKVIMPVPDTLYSEVLGHCQARKAEIHPPRTNADTISLSLRAWSPIKMFSVDPVFDGRTFTNCMVSHSVRNPSMRQQVFARAIVRADTFNSSDSKQVGHMRAYMSMDSVFTVLSVWTDKTSCIKTLMQNSMQHLK